MKKAFVLVDYQNDFIDGSLGFEKATQIKDELLRVLEHFDGDLLLTLDTHTKDYLNTKEGQNLPILHCQKNTEGWNMPSFCEPLKKRAKKIFTKKSFGSLKLAAYLKKQKYEQIEFAGLVSHICVFHTIILAYNALPNARLILHTKASASFDEKLENAAYELLKAFWVEFI